MEALQFVTILDKASPFRDLITGMFPLAEEAMNSTVMAGLDPAIRPQDPKRWNLLSWMAASEDGHDNKGIPNNFDALQATPACGSSASLRASSGSMMGMPFRTG